MQTFNTFYRRKRWTTPQGSDIVAPLPMKIKTLGGHFGPSLHGFIIYQYYHSHVTQPLILEQLLELGIDISAGQVSRVIVEGNELFHKEKGAILQVGLKILGYVNVDDTCARHQGKNRYCTHIGNEMFAWFQSKDSKSRINFLELLKAGANNYALNSKALDYMNERKLPKAQLGRLASFSNIVFEDETACQALLESLGLTNNRHIRITTEGALLGTILELGVIRPDLVILSDDAGQFDVLLHALCWIHAERSINRLVGFNDSQRNTLERIRTQIWEFYRASCKSIF